jgi:hypothetical protein
MLLLPMLSNSADRRSWETSFAVTCRFIFWKSCLQKRTANTLSFFGRWCDLAKRPEQRDVLFRLRQVIFESLAGRSVGVPIVVRGVPEHVQVGNGLEYYATVRLGR